jgi:hypothetical protein
MGKFPSPQELVSVHLRNFTTRWPPMEAGSQLVTTGGAGIREELSWIGGLILSAIGNGLMSAGTGSVTNLGPGLAIIMVRGFLIQLMVGFGFPARNGHLPGSIGAKAMITSAGHLADRAESSWTLHFLCSPVCITFMIGFARPRSSSMIEGFLTGRGASEISVAKHATSKEHGNALFITLGPV